VAEATYYLRLRGKTTGPFTFERLKSLHSRGRLTRYHQVSTDREKWAPLESVAGLMPAPETVPETPTAGAGGAAPVKATPGPEPSPQTPAAADDVPSDPGPGVVPSARDVGDADQVRARRLAYTAAGLSVGALVVCVLSLGAIPCAAIAMSRLRDKALGVVTLIVSILFSTAGILGTWVVLSQSCASVSHVNVPIRRRLPPRPRTNRAGPRRGAAASRPDAKRHPVADQGRHPRTAPSGRPPADRAP